MEKIICPECGEDYLVKLDTGKYECETCEAEFSEDELGED